MCGDDRPSLDAGRQQPVKPVFVFEIDPGRQPGFESPAHRQPLAAAQLFAVFAEQNDTHAGGGIPASCLARPSATR